MRTHPIGAHISEEIAVAILAQIIAARNDKLH
jgi:xanthine/CO dehydrogenase XdhC/CoxF family maturation factor